jgi:hypothetical protein
VNWANWTNWRELTHAGALGIAPTGIARILRRCGLTPCWRKKLRPQSVSRTPCGCNNFNRRFIPPESVKTALQPLAGCTNNSHVAQACRCLRLIPRA